MDNAPSRVATVANISAYAGTDSRAYVDGAPHIKHASLRELYATMVVQIYDFAAQHTTTPTVLDLGAGEGSCTLPFLALGARVTAVDLSPRQLEALRRKCRQFEDRLDVRCQHVDEALLTASKYDIVAANSFLHHVPDYMTMIRRAIDVLSPHGQFFSFEDPLRYDSLRRSTRLFSDLAYGSWRLFKSDVAGGFLRRVRRSLGIYRADSAHDNAEYHVTRNGVDQNAIHDFLEEAGFVCEIVPYFATQSRLFQPLGTALGVKNTFGVIARGRS